MIHVCIRRIDLDSNKEHRTFLFRQKSAIFREVADNPLRYNGNDGSQKTLDDKLNIS